MICRVQRSQELHEAYYKKIYIKDGVEYMAYVSHTFVAIELIPTALSTSYYTCDNIPKPPKYYIEGDVAEIAKKLGALNFYLK